MVELSVRHIEKSLHMRDHQMSLLEEKVDIVTEALCCIESKLNKKLAMELAKRSTKEPIPLVSSMAYTKRLPICP